MTDILMPALSPTMTEGKLAKWLVNEGDAIKPGTVIAEIETDKATMEVEAVDEGTLTKILVPAGTEGVAVNTVIAQLQAEGEAAPAPAPVPARAEAPAKAEAPAPAKAAAPKSAPAPAAAPVAAEPEWSGETQAQTVREALRDAMAEEMRKDPKVLLMGEVIWPPDM